MSESVTEILATVPVALDFAAAIQRRIQALESQSPKLPSHYLAFVAGVCEDAGPLADKVVADVKS